MSFCLCFYFSYNGLWLLLLVCFNTSYLKTTPCSLLNVFTVLWGNNYPNFLLYAVSVSLKCHSHILCDGSAKNVRFCLFCIDFVTKVIKTQEILSKDLFILAELPIVWLITPCNNIFTIIEVNGALAIHVIVHKLLMQNWTKLKFWI